MIADADGARGAERAPRTYGTRVNTREELVEYLRANPLQLRAERSPLPPRPGHPEFVGPVHPDALNRPGALRFNADGAAYFVVEKEKWEESQMARLWAWGIEL